MGYIRNQCQRKHTRTSNPLHQITQVAHIEDDHRKVPRETLQRIHDWVLRNPLKSLAIASLGGMALGRATMEGGMLGLSNTPSKYGQQSIVGSGSPSSSMGDISSDSEISGPSSLADAARHAAGWRKLHETPGSIPLTEIMYKVSPGGSQQSYETYAGDDGITWHRGDLGMRGKVLEPSSFGFQSSSFRPNKIGFPNFPTWVL